MSKFLNIFSKSKIRDVKIRILVDYREKNSLVASELVKLGMEIEFKQLPVADYLIKNIAVERKTLSDFKSSIINKRIINQLLELKQYPSHLLIIEGLESESPYAGIIHENAFRGFVLSVLTDYQVPIVFTLNEKDTAKYLYVLAKKGSQKKEYSIRASKTFKSDKEQLQFILEGFPGIGPATAKRLILHFKSLKNISNAPKEELMNIVGKKSEQIHKLFNLNYES